ncbi:hypothetical protein [Hymenobacter persicinus]|uniref:Uncharacterized protein n=1 Tax=Hymenobacter persicinus TaxID=2025506 RepID=A0A4Q5LI15_9BACT|nr:hypothetical protein [Hymenobacter persicinus]RYU84308.1 hypothetical protein EWM57_01035 [Hymenobacter persicinus]
MKPTLFLYAGLLLLTQCSKCKKDDPTPAEQLPPATQTGANTFGCLVNGQPYTPSGYNGVSNYAVLYDPGFKGGSLDVRTYRYPRPGKSQYLILSSTNIDKPGVYQFSPTAGAFFTDALRPVPCNNYDSSDNNTYSKGTITITRLDLNAGIISGTIDFTLAQPGCDTIKVTQGRFDKKL